jgi:hypothetical protein
VRSEYAEHIGTVIRAHLDNGGGALFLTCTFSHSLTDTAADSLEVAMAAWKAMTASRRWKSLIKWLGVVDWIRVTEMTWTPENGWHPHHHVALLTTRRVGRDENHPEELEEVRQEFDHAWHQAVTNHGREVNPSIGVDLETIRDGAGIGRYVSKVEFELGRGDLKTGRSGSRTPWQISIDAADGDPQSVVLWKEYVAATKQRRWISTSQGLWVRHGINVRTDDEIAEDDGQDDTETVCFLEADVYRAAAAAEPQVLTELRHLLEARTRPEVIAIVLSRRLGRVVDISRSVDDGGLATLGFGSGVGGGERWSRASG